MHSLLPTDRRQRGRDVYCDRRLRTGDPWLAHRTRVLRSPSQTGSFHTQPHAPSLTGKVPGRSEGWPSPKGPSSTQMPFLGSLSTLASVPSLPDPPGNPQPLSTVWPLAKERHPCRRDCSGIGSLVACPWV